MDLREYIIRGKDFNKKEEYKRTKSSLKISANLAPQLTSLQIILIRCTGAWFADGLDQTRMEQIFIIKQSSPLTHQLPKKKAPHR